MPVIVAPQDFHVDDLYIDLLEVFGHRLFLKCEGFNFAGSIKLKAAAEMIDGAERDGLVTPRTTLVESSSGNMGVALSMIAASRGHRFTCVTDVRCNESTVRLMRAFGAEVEVITEPCPDTGFLGARLNRVRALCGRDGDHLWLNQYANPGNWTAHYRTTGPEIVKQFPDLSVVFVGTGTGGTLMGCARYFRDEALPVTVVAVDAVGSVTFGGSPGRRLLPGLGAGTPPPAVDTSFVDDVVLVAEQDAIGVCRELAAHGFLFGASTGSVVAGALSWLRTNSVAGAAVLISPDFGERYLASVYDDSWVHANYEEVTTPSGRTD